jgi:hypothetical protein
MMTKEEIIAANSSIKIGIGNEVFEVSSGDDYDNYINILFETEQENDKKAKETAKKETDKAIAQAKLEALGLTAADLKALGL